MTVMRELQKAHTSASIFCGVFGEAIRQLMPGPLDKTIWGGAQTRRPSTAATAIPQSTEVINTNNDNLQPVVTDDIIESLLNETSTYNFWESINMPEQPFFDYGEQ
jgi:hypothetical protein